MSSVFPEAGYWLSWPYDDLKVTEGFSSDTAFSGAWTFSLLDHVLFYIIPE
jgi:hypothetical protein